MIYKRLIQPYSTHNTTIAHTSTDTVTNPYDIQKAYTTIQHTTEPYSLYNNQHINNLILIALTLSSHAPHPSRYLIPLSTKLYTPSASIKGL